MMAMASVTPERVKTPAQVGEAATHSPLTTAKTSSATPSAVASSTRPGRQKRR